MNNTLLLQQFDLLATAPGGVVRLRELILTLAVQGKLVPQNPADEPASALLKRIRAEKDRLIAEDKIKRDKPLAPIGEDEQLFGLPGGWEWVKGRDLFTVVRGVTYQKTDAKDAPAEGLLPLLRANNIRGVINFEDLVYVPASLISDDQILRSGDYVVCLASGSKNLVGKAAPFRPEVPCSFGAFCGAIRPITDTEYFAVYLASPTYRECVSEASAGIGINNLKGSSLLDLDIALPPLPEQARIVARVEELMRVCDALEATGQRQAAHHRQLVQTLLGDLTADSHTPWQRVAAHFDTLLDRPSAVDALEQTILQLAVRGQLVPQDPTDEPASALLKRIRAEKDRLIAAGKIKRDKPLAPIGEGEQPFELPPGWAWTSLGEICVLITDGTHQTPKYTEAGLPFLSAKNVKPFRFMPNPHRFVSETDFHILRSGRIPNKGDILMTRVGAMIGEAAVIDQEIDFAFYVSLALLGMPANLVSSQYVATWLNSPFGTTKSVEKTLGRGVSAGNLNLSFIRSFAVPLPPLPEQVRIVARVAQLRRLCADLRQRLSQSQTTQAALAEALVAAVAG